MLVGDVCLQCDVTLGVTLEPIYGGLPNSDASGKLHAVDGHLFRRCRQYGAEPQAPNVQPKSPSPKIASDLRRRQQLLAVARGYFAPVCHSARDSMACAPSG